MQPPIPAGTLLQNRYCLTKVIGQGGFGRTYLAQDQGRFNECCVVKEYIPPQGGDYALEKSKELFQREAEILYQLRHPQVPQFHVVFEQGRRLFLVQEYVEGKTYSKLLEERSQMGQAFSEGEVMHLLENTLPILDYIHTKGIIHRDISPDNLILRDRDQLPVLIDFGVVKEIAGQLQGLGHTQQGTTVGKLGFSPSEQLQTGKVYPNSDLYALAVTAVVMMTGRQPQDLLDETTMTWHWQQRLPGLNPRLAQLLSRMMNARPNNRYQSAIEVLQALRSLSGLVQPAVSPISGSRPTQIGAESIHVQDQRGWASAPPATQAATVPQSTRAVSPGGRSHVKTTVTGQSFSSFPRLGWVMIGAVLLAITLSPWFVLHSVLRNQANQNLGSPSPIANPTAPNAVVPGDPSPTVASSPTPNSGDGGTLIFPDGQDTLETKGWAGPRRNTRFSIVGQEAQVLNIQVSPVTEGTVTLEVRDPTGVILTAPSVSSWQSLPLVREGLYQIVVQAPQDTQFKLVVTRSGGRVKPPPISPGASPSPASPSPSPASPSPASPSPLPAEPNLDASPQPPTPSPTPDGTDTSGRESAVQFP